MSCGSKKIAGSNPEGTSLCRLKTHRALVTFPRKRNVMFYFLFCLLNLSGRIPGYYSGCVGSNPTGGNHIVLVWNMYTCLGTLHVNRTSHFYHALLSRKCEVVGLIGISTSISEGATPLKSSLLWEPSDLKSNALSSIMFCSSETFVVHGHQSISNGGTLVRLYARTLAPLVCWNGTRKRLFTGAIPFQNSVWGPFHFTETPFYNALESGDEYGASRFLGRATGNKGSSPFLGAWGKYVWRLSRRDRELIPFRMKPDSCRTTGVRFPWCLPKRFSVCP